MGGVCAKVHVARDEGVAPSKQGVGGDGVGDGVVGLGRAERGVFPMPGMYDSGELRLFDSGKFKARPAGSAAHSRTGSGMVPEFSSLLGRAGAMSLGKAVEVLDTLGSSVSNLNPSGSFVSGIASHKTKLTILAFEVANTIVKGSYLMQSFSEENIQFLKKEVLLSDGVQRLVSTDMEELLTIAGADKKEELDVFSREVVRFGDLCKDPQWHNLGRYFQKLNSDFFLHKMQKEDAERTMQQLVTMAQQTSVLYHELHTLDRLEQDYLRKAHEEAALNVTRSGAGEDLMILHSEVKRQRRIVKRLQKKSLWSKNLEEIIGELVDIVTFLSQELNEALGSAVFKLIEDGPDQHPNRLGPCGLALHYANVINQIDNIVARPSSIPPNTRDTLYHALPSSVKVALRSRLQSFSAGKELTVAEIKAEMEKTLHWIVPMASNTMKAHQGFGWVGEWANMSNYFDKKSSNNVLRIQTLHHALNDKTDKHILELVAWLHQLVIQAKHRNYGLRGLVQQQVKSNNIPSPAPVASENKDGHGQDPSRMSNKNIRLTEDEGKLLEEVSSRRFVPGLSKSQGSGCSEKKGNMEIGWRRRCNSFSIARSSSKISSVEYGKTRDLDVMDGLPTLFASYLGQSI